ncbi:hypothetical protein C7974DRAFT_397000 [Boeremia exigua]|uniref:uncharacterized protein n=1 Tax=Boeremia exigua TaxID=749465 RepID=UPI001E8EAE85|nr:uncharacterized protein C7974DRAFT_397000 [Boeremia exigua]KAH6621704.1 hypothetical protein C7974DRAFT_397000 [Boeremia exigua]
MSNFTMGCRQQASWMGSLIFFAFLGVSARTCLEVHKLPTRTRDCEKCNKPRKGTVTHLERTPSQKPFPGRAARCWLTDRVAG